jgi:OPA family glycerol-3-phosphate transporter-like MFS transporter
VNQTPAVDRPDVANRRVRRWQLLTLGTLFVGYAGYYICRSNLSVATPLLLDEFGPSGLTKAHIGTVASVGLLLYAVGKVCNGIFADLLGGRVLFLTGMFASALCTVLFGLGAGLAVFVLVWAANRFVQSMGWVSLVQVSSRWYAPSVHATVLGVLSASYLFGDAFAHLYLGEFIRLGAGWRGVFFAAAATLAGLGLVSVFTLKASPRAVGGEEPEDSPENVFADEMGGFPPSHLAVHEGVSEGSSSAIREPGKIQQAGSPHPSGPGFPPRESAPEGLRLSLSAAGRPWSLLAPLFRSPAFWLVCAINVGLTLIRMTFNFWTPTYLTEVARMSNADAAQWSLLFPLVGALSAILAGALSDRLRTRTVILLPSLILLVLALGALARLRLDGRPVLALVMICGVSFALLAPYSFLSGVLALDLGGKRGSATAAGFIDSAGYLGGIASGYGVGAVAEHFGWSMAFGLLAGAAGLTALPTLLYCLRGRPRPPSPPTPS